MPGGAILQYTGPVLGPELLSIDSCDEFGLIVQIVDKRLPIRQTVGRSRMDASACP